MNDDKHLDNVFAKIRDEIRDEENFPSEAFLDRVMLDADNVLAQAGVGAPAREPAPAGFGAMMLDLIGGWPSFGGLAAATLAGVWIGVSPPDALADLSAGLLGSTVEVSLFETDVFAGLDG